MKEIWKDIDSYEGIYQVSNLGNVRSLDREVTEERHPMTGNPWVRKLKGKNLVKSKSGGGYLQVTLNGKNQYVHRLVALAFLENPNGLPEVNHEDGDKTNCREDNLVWCTRKDNMQHAERTGLMKHAKGSKNGAAKLTEEDVTKIKQLLKNGVKGNVIAKMFNVYPSTISTIKTGKWWKHIGVVMNDQKH
jgi:hypothetical protein